MRVTMPINQRYKEEGLHLLINARQKDHILRSVLEHLFAQWTFCVPESFVKPHLLCDIYFVSVLGIAKVLL